jgi:hypothetical protein
MKICREIIRLTNHPLAAKTFKDVARKPIIVHFELDCGMVAEVYSDRSEPVCLTPTITSVIPSNGVVVPPALNQGQMTRFFGHSIKIFLPAGTEALNVCNFSSPYVIQNTKLT